MGTKPLGVADFWVRDAGSLLQFTARSTAAKGEVECMNIEDWQWMGEWFGMDRRVGIKLGALLKENGFTIERVA